MIADRVGRTRTLMLTMLLYALGTAACAAAPNILWLALCRLVASLGIGGEWAAGASMVAEAVPEEKRVEAGALLYTAAPLGLFLATFVNHQVAAVWMAESPETSWRIVFLFGLVPAALAFGVRMFVREPERWKAVKAKLPPARIRELFGPDIVGITLRGTLMAVVALVTWWSCNAFIPSIATGLAQTAALEDGLDLRRVRHALATGGPAAALLLHRPVGVRSVRQLHLLPPRTVPHAAARHRVRVLLQHRPAVRRSPGPLIVGSIAARGVDHAMQAIAVVALVPLMGLLLVPFIIETRGRALAD